MDRLVRHLSTGAFYVMMLVLLAFTTSQTVDLIDLLLPSAGLLKYAVIIIFDGGPPLWGLLYEHKADGAIQRTIALVMVVFSIVGVGLIVFTELMLGGQTLVDVDVAVFGTRAIMVIGIYTVVTLAASFGFALSSQKSLDATAMQNAQDDIAELARSMLKDSMESSAKRLAAPLAVKMEKHVASEMVLNYHESQTTQGAVLLGVKEYICIAKNNNGTDCTNAVDEPLGLCGTHKRKAERANHTVID